MTDYLEELEAEISKNHPPRRVALRPYSRAWKRWTLLGILNAICLGFFIWLAFLSIPFWSDSFGIAVIGQITGKQVGANGYCLDITYSSRDSKVHALQMEVGDYFYGQCPAKGQICLHYLPWLPSRPSFDGNTDPNTTPEILGPFVVAIYAVGYLAFFISLWGEYRLFQRGVLVRARVVDVSIGKDAHATVSFTYKEKEYVKTVGGYWKMGEEALALVNPDRPTSSRIYFQGNPSIFQVASPKEGLILGDN